MKKSFLVSCATVGPVGYIKGSGTLASFITLPFIYWLRNYSNFTYVIIMASIIIVALITTQRALRAFRQDHDPSEIVIDEVVGCFITFCGRSITFPSLVLGFLLFRFLDIYKPCGIKKIEIFKGAWGITLDDVLAGVISNIVLWIVGF